MAIADEQVKTVRIVIDASKAKDGAADVEKALKSIDDKLASLGDSVGRAFSGLRNALLGFLSFDALLTQVRGLTEAFDRLGTKARTLGTTTDWLQGFDYALASNTVKLDEGYKALERFTRLVGEGAQGNRAAVEVLDRLGVKIFDVNRQVRPVSDLFEEAARKIGGMTAGAQQNTLAIQAMGKTATAVIPALQDIGKGADAMQQAGEKAGAIVKRETVKIWEDLATASDRAMIQWRTFAGENFAESVKKGFELISGSIAAALKMLRDFSGVAQDLWDKAKAFAREQTQKGIREDIIPNAERDLERQREVLRPLELRLNTLRGNVERNPTGAARSNLEAGQTAYDAQVGRVTRLEGYIADQRRRLAELQNGNTGPDQVLNGLDTLAGGGGRLPDPSAGGTTGAHAATAADPGAADRQMKRIQLLEAEAAATRKMADAARDGAAAVNEQEAGFKAIQQALEAYGAGADRNDPKVKALAERFRALNQEIADNKAVTAFRLQTEDLGRQNAVLERRVDLLGEAPEVVAREIGQLQARNEAAKAGARISEEDIAARGAAAEKQELLNQKIQQAQRTQELWLQPLKSALSSMQQGLAGLFEGLFTGGINSWQQFTEAMKRIWLRMLAELAAVSVLRVALQPVMGAGQAIGLISPGVAGQLGYGAGGSILGGGGLGGGGLGGGGSSQMLGFLNRPIFGQNFGGYANGASEFASLTNTPMGSGLSQWANGLTWGQGLGALAGAGMGIYSLATSRSTGQTLGGIASLVGAGVSLIPGVGQIAGPIIGMLGGLLPGLFGGGAPEPPALRATGGLNFRGGRFTSSGSEYNGASSVVGTLGGVGKGLEELLKGAGVTLKDAPWGLTYQTFSQGDFSNATTYVNGKQWGQGSGADAGLDTASAHIAHKIMLEVNSGISETMRRGLSTFGKTNLQHAFSTQELGQAVADIKAFEEAIKGLGKTTTAAEQALKQVDDSFKGLLETADKYGLDKAGVERRKAEARTAVGTDFADQLSNTLRGLKDPYEQAIVEANLERKGLLQNNEYLKANVAGYLDQINKIEELYGIRRKAIVEQQAAAVTAAQQRAAAAANDLVSAAIASVERLQGLVRQLSPGGALANQDPRSQLAGLRATYAASYAQAIANPGSADLVMRATENAQALAEYGLRFYAGSSGYGEIRDQLLGQAQALQVGVARTGSTAVAGQVGKNADANLQQLVSLMSQLVASSSRNDNSQAQRDADIAQLIALLKRVVTRPAA
jgi:hypothetical protein